MFETIVRQGLLHFSVFCRHHGIQCLPIRHQFFEKAVPKDVVSACVRSQHKYAPRSTWVGMHSLSVEALCLGDGHMAVSYFMATTAEINAANVFQRVSAYAGDSLPKA